MEPSINPNISPQQNPNSLNSESTTPESNNNNSAAEQHGDSLPEMTAPAAYERDTTNREAANQNQGMQLPPVVNDPITPAPVVSNDNSQQQNTQSTTLNPATADDVDVVEKEWVDRARKIVEENRDNPYKQEQEVEKLQTDYLKKRYGKDLKSADA